MRDYSPLYRVRTLHGLVSEVLSHESLNGVVMADRRDVLLSGEPNSGCRVYGKRAPAHRDFLHITNGAKLCRNRCFSVITSPLLLVLTTNSLNPCSHSICFYCMALLAWSYTRHHF